MPVLSYEEILRQLRQKPLPDEPPKPPAQTTPTGPYRPNGGVGQVPGVTPTPPPTGHGPNDIGNAKPGVVPPTSPVYHDPRGNIAQAGPGVPKPDGQIARTLPLGDEVPTEGKGLSLAHLFEAYQRGALGPDKKANDKALQDRLKVAADAGEIRPEDIPVYTSLAQKTPSTVSPTQLSAALQKGVLNDQQVKDRLTQIYGDKTDDAAVMYQLIKKDGQKSLDLSQIQKALKDGKMQPADALKRMTDLGYQPQDANILLGSMQKDKTLDLGTLQSSYKNGAITKDELEKRVRNNYDLSPADAELTIKDMLAPKNPALGTLGDVYMAGRLDDDTAVQRLMKEQNYSEADARDILATWSKNKTEKAEERQYRDEQRAQSAQDRLDAQGRRAEADKRQAISDQRQKESDARQAKAEQVRGFQGTTFSDGVNGYLENFHTDFLTSLRNANLTPQATHWLASNPHLALTQSLGNGKTGGILSGQALQTLYEGSRGETGADRRTRDASIDAQQIGG